VWPDFDIAYSSTMIEDIIKCVDARNDSKLLLQTTYLPFYFSALHRVDLAQGTKDYSLATTFQTTRT
jgi:hypothetical protein